MDYIGLGVQLTTKKQEIGYKYQPQNLKDGILSSYKVDQIEIIR